VSEENRVPTPTLMSVGALNVAVIGQPGLDGLFPAAGFDANAFAKIKRLRPLVSNARTHVDHVFPKGRGGSNHLTNLSCIPAADNLSKGSKILPGRILKNAAKWNLVIGLLVGGAVTGYHLWQGEELGDALWSGAKAGTVTFISGTALTVAVGCSPVIGSMAVLGTAGYGGWRLLHSATTSPES